MAKGVLKQIRKKAVVRSDSDKDIESRFIVLKYCEGRSISEVTKLLNDEREREGKEGVSESVVSKVISEMRGELKRASLSDMKEYYERSYANLEKLRLHAKHEYLVSKNLKPKEYAPLLKLGYTLDEIKEMFKDTEYSGDSSLLQVQLAIEEQQMKLRGVDKGDISQTNVVNYNFDGMSKDELAKIADGLQDNKAKEIIASKVVDEQ